MAAMTQTELNKMLYDAVSVDNIDISYIKELLDQGADPIGSIEDDEDCYENPLFSEIS